MDKIKKYELIQDDTIIIGNKTLYRIKALKSFGNTEQGDLGGYIQNEYNLSQGGQCWISGNAKVYGNAVVREGANVGGNAKMYGFAKARGDAYILNNAKVYDDAIVGGSALIADNAIVYGRSMIYGASIVQGNADVSGSEIYGDVNIYGKVHYALITGDAYVGEDSDIDSKLDCIVICAIGSEGGTLAAYRTKSSGIKVTRGCFEGTPYEFSKAVNETHGDSNIGDEYRAIINLINIRFELPKEVTNCGKINEI